MIDFSRPNAMVELAQFVEESNRIEGIHTVRPGELHAMRQFLEKEKIETADLTRLGEAFEKRCVLREKPGMDVIVGSHMPPGGGPAIPTALKALLASAMELAEHASSMETYQTHIVFETLHPFMDGNGRTGRALFLWQELHANRERVLKLGFLHEWYYRSLEASR